MPDPQPNQQAVLVTDFDGTVTRRDFYQLVIDELLPPGTPDYWSWYVAGKVSHFEALRLTFAAAPAGEERLAALAGKMEIEPELAGEVAALGNAGWRVVVASAGCLWYIQRLLDAAGVALEVHANPGKIEGGRLMMSLPVDSPFYAPETGIDKAAVVRDAIARGGPVAFAGDGPPDVVPALMVPPGLRFARGYLAGELARRGEPFRPFERWAEVARAVRGDAG